MAKKRDYPVFNTVMEDFNKAEYKKFNIFRGYYISEFLDKYKKKPTKERNKEDFAEQLKRECKYSYWGKSEYEIIISPWGGRAPEKKVDVWNQIELNWDIVVDLGWNYVKPRSEK